MEELSLAAEVSLTRGDVVSKSSSREKMLPELSHGFLSLLEAKSNQSSLEMLSLESLLATESSETESSFFALLAASHLPMGAEARQ